MLRRSQHTKTEDVAPKEEEEGIHYAVRTVHLNKMDYFSSLNG